MKIQKLLKIAVLIISGLLVTLVLVFILWTRIARYPAFPEAELAAHNASKQDNCFIFKADEPPKAGFIFYPGGLVDPRAYAPLLSLLAEKGITSFLILMPLDLALFGINRGAAVIKENPQIGTWFLGGHSLGGLMAAEFASENSDSFKGLIFLASYPAPNLDLSRLPYNTLTIVGSKNSQPVSIYRESLKRLPPHSDLIILDGANHAQFGNYGPQKGDGRATISRDNQQLLTADYIISYIQDRLSP